jgi:excinuclease ABC subunit C
MFFMFRKQLDQYDIPDAPGVYLFKKGRKVLYVGKATSLRDRVRSYFARDLVGARGERIVGMVDKAATLSWEETGSVLEALMRESALIKKLKPPYNVDEKDNKSWNYIVISKESQPVGGFPRVLLVRGRELNQSWNAKDIRHLFGPFPHGGQLKEALKIVRKIFPYRDSCTPESGKPCFNRQIGLCPGVCSGEMGAAEYAVRIRHLKELFSGNFKGLKRSLAREMKAAADAEDFERAAVLRKQIAGLEHIRDVALIKEDLSSTGGGIRIESYDVAHTAGTETVAVMTVVDGGEPVRAAYRKFKIQTVRNNDVAALSEALERRLAHDEWPLPRVIVVDGGQAQVRAAERVLKRAGVLIPVMGVVKDERHKPVGIIGETRIRETHEKDILLANSEAHRYAITWHRQRRGKIY